jgi:hypothetical protein
MSQKLDWDQEGRDRRAREHGRQSAKIDRASEDELEAVVQIRKEAASAEFHRLAEPARRVASDFRRVPREEREHRLREHLTRMHTAIDDAVARARTDEMRKQLRMYRDGLEQRFFRKRGESQRTFRRRRRAERRDDTGD